MIDKSEMFSYCGGDMSDPCMFQDVIMKNVADTAKQGQAIEGMAGDMKKVAYNVEVIAEKMTSMRGFIAGIAAAFGLLGTIIGWVLKSLPAAAATVIK